MSEVLSISDEQIEKNYKILQAGVQAYSPRARAANHLRKHQRRGIAGYREQVSEIEIDEFAKGTGIAVVSSTGSGKTVIGTEAVRMAKLGVEALYNGSSTPLGALWLVNLNSAETQTIGLDGMKGVGAFAPDLSIDSYGSKKRTAVDIKVMKYHSLGRAISSGAIDRLSPPLVVADEMHHVIDKVWHRQLTDIGPGRLKVGLSASPRSSEKRDVFGTFPRIAMEEYLPDGVRDGYVSPVKTFTYDAQTPLSPRITLGEFNREDVFEALINSPDNYTLAQIMAAEVALGRRALVCCAPGHDRAHSRVMTMILNKTLTTDIHTGKERYMRAVHVDGDTGDLEEQTRRIRNNEIDVISQVGLTGESWDCPEIDTLGINDPTLGMIKAIQRVGRGVRPREGKIATMHEMVYRDHEGRRIPQVTVHDTMDIDFLKSGRKAPKTTTQKPGSKKASPEAVFSVDDYQVDEVILQQMRRQEIAPREEMMVLTSGKEAIPFDWVSEPRLQNLLQMDQDELRALAEELDVEGKDEDQDTVTIRFYPPRLMTEIAKKKEYKKIPKKGFCTAGDLLAFAREQAAYVNLSRKGMLELLEEEEMQPTSFIAASGQLIQMYPNKTKNIFKPRRVNAKAPIVNKTAGPVKLEPERRAAPSTPSTARKRPVSKKKSTRKRRNPSQEQLNRRTVEGQAVVILANWLNNTTITPQDVARLPRLQRDNIICAQEALAQALNQKTPPDVPKEFAAVVGKVNIELSPRTEEVRSSFKMTPEQILFAALRARKVAELSGKRRA